MSSLDQAAHRPYPLANKRWVMGQRWHDLLFAHWRLDPEVLQRQLPEQLEIDTFDGSAWLAVVPFAMTDVRARGLPGLTRASRFLELNVRTYVRFGDVDGVYFFSLDASSKTAVAAARRWFHLPYFNARMELRRHADWIHYQSHRTHRGAGPANFAVSYRPTGFAETARAGSLEEWLVERYRLLVPRPDGAILSGEIHHGSWLLQPAEVAVHRNSMAEWFGVKLDRPPDHVRFARFQDVFVWRPRPVAVSRESEFDSG